MTVYLIRNLINNKVYIGKTVRRDFTVRCKQHFRGRGHAPYLYLAIKKHGFENFSFTIIYKALSNVELCDAERFFIKKFKSRDRKFGYNLTDGGDGTSGYRPSDETLKKLRESHVGHSHSSETKARMSNSRKKYLKKHPEVREYMSRRMMGNKHSVGYYPSNDHRRKISNALKGRSFSKEQRDRISKSRIGMHFSIEHRENISKALKGKPSNNLGRHWHLSEEARKNISRGHLIYWKKIKENRNAQ